MFDVSGLEFLALAALALLVFGPDKLPKVAADAARLLRHLRSVIASAREDVRRELGPELGDLSVADLDPRTLVRRHVLDPEDVLGEPDAGARRPGPTSGPAGPPPYDPDAT